MDDKALMKIFVVLRYVCFVVITLLAISGVFDKTKRAARHLDQGGLLPAWFFAIL